jgi:hypothetical protein
VKRVVSNFLHFYSDLLHVVVDILPHSALEELL